MRPISQHPTMVGTSHRGLTATFCERCGGV
jgi:hypothetical protein